MAHKHSVYDTDAHFKIDAITRAIKNESSGKTVLIQGDHNSERFTFEIPKLVDGHDMSLCNVAQIHYINIDSTDKSKTSADVYEVDDLQISPDSEDVVILSWQISGNATKYAGSLNFLVKFKCVGDDGTVDYVWNTGIFTGISVSAGIDNGEAVVEEYSDVLEQWRVTLDQYDARITGLEQLTGDDIPTAADDTVPIANRINTIQDYIYTTEKLCKFVTSADAILEIDTDTNKVKVNSGFLFYRNSRMDTAETTVDIDQTSVFSMIVRDSAKKAIRSIAPTSFDGETMFVIAILRRGYYTIPTANYVIGAYKVNGFMYNEPTRQPVYVSTTGSDSNVGDRHHPFKTIGKAVNSRAKTIFVFAGTYQEAVSASRTGDEIEIIAKPNSYADNAVVIDLGHSLTMEEDADTGLIKAAYASAADDFIYKVFVDGTEALTAEDSNGYVCNLWSGDTRLVPVLTLEECQATAGTWFYDGTNVYANGAAGTYTLSDGASEYGIHLSYFKKVVLKGVTVRYARKDAIRLDACNSAEIDRCGFCYSGLYHGLALESTSAVVRNCGAKYNGKDGLNIHGVCTADFIDCVSHHNGDDGISHHDQSGGMVIGGEYYNNVKGGVCSPTFGSRNGINGVYTHDNGSGVYAVTGEDGDYPPCTVTNCAIVNNAIGIRSARYTLNCWNNVLSGNGADTSAENGGVINMIE